MAKLLHVAGDINRTVVLESVLLLGVFQKLQEQRVVDVDDGDYEALLLLLPLAHHNRQASFRYAPQILLLLHVMNVENISATHLDRKILFQRKIKEEKSEFEIDLEVAGRELIKWMKKSMEKDRAGLQGEDDERERPRIGSGDGEIEERERRIDLILRPNHRPNDVAAMRSLKLNNGFSNITTRAEVGSLMSATSNLAGGPNLL
nr:uncharacterized protein LOC114761440 [Ipomoea batatas]